jgi:kynurenine formamidase
MADGSGDTRAAPDINNRSTHEERRQVSANVLSELGLLLLAGKVEIVDLSAPLGPDTPILKPPPELAVDTPRIEIHKISEYDDRGPFWAWNWLKLGEHSGTHFDAPHHWVTGKDYADGYTDTIPVSKFVAPVNVIDCSVQTAADADFILTADAVKSWEVRHGAIAPGEWVLMRTDWDKRNNSEAFFLNADENGPHSPGPSVDCIEYILERGAIGWGSQFIGTDAGAAGGFTPPFPAHNLLHKWLRNHPSVEVVSPDRCGLYAQAIREGALQARQVADRLHLLQNLRMAIEEQMSLYGSATGRAILSDDASQACSFRSYAISPENIGDASRLARRGPVQ